MATSLLTSLFRRTPKPAANTHPLPFTAATNPYHCKRTWPPDFTQLSQKHQFRLERRYRRRTQLKWARPGWKKGVTLAQWGSILFVLVYGTLYLDVGRGRTVMDDIREWMDGEFVGFREPRRRTAGEWEMGKAGGRERG